MEANEELPNKSTLFFAHAANKWSADFYAKVNDDVYVNIGQFFLQWMKVQTIFIIDICNALLYLLI